MEIQQRCLALLERSLSLIPQELDDLDWKSGLSPNRERLAQHLSAFSNHLQGGFIVFGVNEDLTLSNVTREEADQIKATFTNLARDAVSPPIMHEFFTLQYGGRNLYVCYIYQSQQRPVHLKKRPEEAYIRAGGTTRKMSPEEIRQALLSTRQLRFEEHPAPPVTGDWNDKLDVETILGRLKRNFSTRSLRDEFLLSYGLLTKINGAYHPTNLGILLAAKDFNEWPGFEKLGIRVTIYSGLDKLSPKKEQEFSMGYALALDDVVNAVSGALPKRELFIGATRVDEPIIPNVALRETIVNAVMHRDLYTNSSYTAAEVYFDRVEITNPGHLPFGLTVDRLIDHPSVTPNELLAKKLRLLGFAEEQGSGFDKVAGALEYSGLPTYKVITAGETIRVILPGLGNISDMPEEERLEVVYIHACLNAVSNRKTTNESIRSRFRLSDNSANRAKVTALIRAAIDSKKIKLANPQATRRRDYWYAPYWA